MTPQELLQRIEALERMVKEQRHDGVDGQEISIQNLVDTIPTVSVAPTTTPKRFRDQFVIYKNSTTYRFYWYDTVSAAWHYVTATA